MAKAQPDLVEVNEVAAQIARTQAGTLVVNLTKAKQRRLRTVLARSLDQGWSDLRTQEAIASVVGLDDRYAQAVEKYRAGLLEGGMSAGKAKQAALSYSKRLLVRRAQTIAASEIQQALMDAQRLLWDQQRDDGDLSRYAVRVWRVHKDERRCAICRPMNGRKASLKTGGGYVVPGVGRVVGPPVHPNCRCYEEVVDQGITKAAEVEEINKHLPGQHNQKTHGRRGKRVFPLLASGFTPAIQQHLKEIQNGPDVAAAGFAASMQRLGREFPEIAKNVRGIDISPGATKDFKQSDGNAPIAYARMSDHGTFISADPDEMVAYARRAWNRVRSNEPPWGLPEAGIGAKDSSFLIDIAQGIAVHEWGHAAHWHALASDLKATGVVEDRSEGAAMARNRMHNPSIFEGVPVLSTYGASKYIESVAEWFTAYYFEMDQGDMPDYLVSAFEKAWSKPVSVSRGVIKRQHEHTDCGTFDGSLVETWAQERLTDISKIVGPEGSGLYVKGALKTMSVGRLDRSPKKNWVEESGGLPKYIEDIAVALHEKRGMDISRAIAVAINRCKMWAAGGADVDPDTRAKAAKAIIEWEALRAKAKET